MHGKVWVQQTQMLPCEKLKTRLKLCWSVPCWSWDAENILVWDYFWASNENEAYIRIDWLEQKSPFVMTHVGVWLVGLIYGIGTCRVRGYFSNIFIKKGHLFLYRHRPMLGCIFHSVSGACYLILGTGHSSHSLWYILLKNKQLIWTSKIASRVRYETVSVDLADW